MAAFASGESKSIANINVLFTDPSSLGTNEYYTSTGDVDDVACIIYMSQKLGEKLIVVICDDESGRRHSSFISHLGGLLSAKHNITVIPEDHFSSGIMSEETTIYIHAPIKNSTADVLNSSKANISSIFTQGDDSSVNFKNSEKAKLFLAEAAESGISLNRFNTAETNFRIPYNSDFENSLTNPVCKKVYSDYFLFEKRKSFGTALHLGFLCNRLYSDTGFEGRPGNGINKYKDLIQELKNDPNFVFPELSGDLLTAFETTVEHGSCDPTAIQNGKDLISLMNLYCHYDRLIVDGKLPNMGNLGEIAKRSHVDSRVAEAFDAVSQSTPLFDFAAAYFALEGRVEKDVLIEKVEKSLTDLDTSSGGRRRRRRRKSRKKTKKKRKSKKGGKRKRRKTKKKRRRSRRR